MAKEREGNGDHTAIANIDQHWLFPQEWFFSVSSAIPQMLNWELTTNRSQVQLQSTPWWSISGGQAQPMSLKLFCSQWMKEREI